jgi:flagellar biosynthesis GTPase FlhF
MSDETTQPNPEPSPNPPETQNSEAGSIPVSSQEPLADAVIPPTESVPAEVPPVAPEILPSPESAVPLKDQNDANEPLKQTSSPEITVDPTNPDITVERHENDVTITEVMQPTAHSKSSTAQMAGNEPFDIVEEEKIKKREENLKLANETRQEKKREKINEILNLFAERQTVTNDEVEKLLHVSDATATRYLETLEKEGKIKQVGKTGKGVTYEKI